MRRPKLTTRQGELEHLRRPRRAHRQQRMPSVPRPPATRDGDPLQHHRQREERKPKPPPATRLRALHRRLPRASHLHPLVLPSLSSEHLPPLQMPASSRTNLLHRRIARGHSLGLPPGLPRRLYHQRHRYPPRTNLREASLAFRLHSQAIVCPRAHRHLLQVAGPFHLRLLRETLLQRLHHCRRRLRALHSPLLRRR
jgi:hypothetical protein